MSLKRACRSSLTALLQDVVLVEVVVVVVDTLANRLELSKFTIFLKLVFKLKSFGNPLQTH